MKLRVPKYMADKWQEDLGLDKYDEDVFPQISFLQGIH